MLSLPDNHLEVSSNTIPRGAPTKGVNIKSGSDGVSTRPSIVYSNRVLCKADPRADFKTE